MYFLNKKNIPHIKLLHYTYVCIKRQLIIQLSLPPFSDTYITTYTFHKERSRSYFIFSFSTFFFTLFLFIFPVITLKALADPAKKDTILSLLLVILLTQLISIHLSDSNVLNYISVVDQNSERSQTISFHQIEILVIANI